MQLSGIFYMVAVALAVVENGASRARSIAALGWSSRPSRPWRHLGASAVRWSHSHSMTSWGHDLKNCRLWLQFFKSMSEQKSLRDEQRKLTELLKELVQSRGRKARPMQWGHHQLHQRLWGQHCAAKRSTGDPPPQLEFDPSLTVAVQPLLPPPLHELC